MYKKIAIAYDESSSSEHALATAISLAATLGSSLRIITVVEPLPLYVNISLAVDPDLPQQLLNERRERFELAIQLALKHAAEAGVVADAALIEGREVEGILAEVGACHADLLVLGLRQHIGFGEMGSTAHRIAMRVTCPILGVP
ncbi:MAG: universal stress protein [Acidobacteriota bacterium]|jgi:nucleotide-binding universal stress UspA family protein